MDCALLRQRTLIFQQQLNTSVTLWGIIRKGNWRKGPFYNRYSCLIIVNGYVSAISPRIVEKKSGCFSPTSRPSESAIEEKTNGASTIPWAPLGETATHSRYLEHSVRRNSTLLSIASRASSVPLPTIFSANPMPTISDFFVMSGYFAASTCWTICARFLPNV